VANESKRGSESEIENAAPNPAEVDPWRFAGSFLGNLLGKSIPAEPTHGPIPWTPFAGPLSNAKVALLSTAGISMKDDAPFDMEFERKHPTRGDSSFRRLRAEATAEQIDANHLHIDTGYIERDLNVALPLDRLRDLVSEGHVGSMAETHYSIMGFQGADASQLENDSAPAIAEIMKSEEVDLALLAPV
jgi:D-proline reductase (dithiol) PrdB